MKYLAVLMLVMLAAASIVIAFADEASINLRFWNIHRAQPGYYNITQSDWVQENDRYVLRLEYDWNLQEGRPVAVKGLYYRVIGVPWVYVDACVEDVEGPLLFVSLFHKEKSGDKWERLRTEVYYENETGAGLVGLYVWVVYDEWNVTTGYNYHYAWSWHVENAGTCFKLTITPAFIYYSFAMTENETAYVYYFAYKIFLDATPAELEPSQLYTPEAINSTIYVYRMIDNITEPFTIGRIEDALNHIADWTVWIGVGLAWYDPDSISPYSSYSPTASGVLKIKNVGVYDYRPRLYPIAYAIIGGEEIEEWHDIELNITSGDVQKYVSAFTLVYLVFLLLPIAAALLMARFAGRFAGATFGLFVYAVEGFAIVGFNAFMLAAIAIGMEVLLMLIRGE